MATRARADLSFIVRAEGVPHVCMECGETCNFVWVFGYLDCTTEYLCDDDVSWKVKDVYRAE